MEKKGHVVEFCFVGTVGGSNGKGKGNMILLDDLKPGVRLQGSQMSRRKCEKISNYIFSSLLARKTQNLKKSRKFEKHFWLVSTNCKYLIR